MKTSPYNYFQERYRDDPWKMLCCAIMLNMTSGKQLERVHEKFFEKYKNAGDVIIHYLFDINKQEMEDILRPLGMQTKRAYTLFRFSSDFNNGKCPRDCYGIGKYGGDSYKIFIEGILIDDAKDKELLKYIEWAKGQTE